MVARSLRLTPSGSAYRPGQDRAGRIRVGRMSAVPRPPGCDHQGMHDPDARDAFATRAVHAGAEPDGATGAVSPPIYQTSTYAQDGVGRPRGGYEYARTQNPTRERLERAVADLEGGRHGIAFASGSAATAAIAQLAAGGDEILVGDDVYGGTFRYFERVHRPAGAGEARYADLAADPDALWEGLTPATRLVWLETPSNPLLKVTDIAAAARTIHEHATQAGGPRPLLVIDNTFASPALQRPLELGADVVFHSATKYLGGHSDTVLGVAVTSDDEVAARLRFLQNAMGAVPGPFDCFLVLRGLRTLAVRMERHSANALAVARFLASRADVAWVRYPGLAEGPHAHPGAEVAARQMTAAGGGPAFGGMVSFIPAPGGAHGRSAADRAIALCEATRLFTLAESLGGVESLVEVPAAMTHMSVASSPLAVDPALVRLSVGIEAVDDLVADLAQALDRA
jgi:cystathionine gamma-synthase